MGKDANILYHLNSLIFVWQSHREVNESIRSMAHDILHKWCMTHWLFLFFSLSCDIQHILFTINCVSVGSQADQQKKTMCKKPADCSSGCQPLKWYSGRLSIRLLETLLHFWTALLIWVTAKTKASVCCVGESPEGCSFRFQVGTCQPM